MDLYFWKKLVASVPSQSFQNQKLLRKIKLLFHRIFSCSHITSSECHLLFTQWSKFLDESSSAISPAFKKIHVGVRLEEFYFETVKIGLNYRVFSKVLIFIFTLGHGQASIERDFTINSNMLKENMKKIHLSPLHYRRCYGVQQIKDSPSENQHGNDKGCFEV